MKKPRYKIICLWHGGWGLTENGMYVSSPLIWRGRLPCWFEVEETQ